MAPPRADPAGALLGDRLPHLLYGGDYNPEQWPETVWVEDVRLMREAGVNIVSVGIFSWARLEPAAGQFDFAWLDRVLDLLHEGGIAVDLATATASPPQWLSHAHPEMLPQLADGVRLWPGGRQHYCPSSPIYREATRRLVESLAGHYSSHPALAMWHVGNEYACHVPACYCDVSAAAFRKWLQGRYPSLEELNGAWGTDFWSQRFTAWEQILPPRRTPTWPNPGQTLDFQRFSSDELLACYDVERGVLTELCPGVPVTTNFMRFFKPLDYWKWASHEDIVSNDSYPDPNHPDSGWEAAMDGDLMRSLGGGRPWIQMEQTPNRVNWRPLNAAKRPGQMRLWSLQAVARGADGILFFQWRQSRAGAEKFHSAMVPHGPVETDPTWNAVAGLGADLRRLDPVCGSRIQAEVAIVFDWESWWALELPSKPSTELMLMDQVRSYYRHLFQANVTADFVHPEADLSGYKLLLVPNLYLVSDRAAASLEQFVGNGGTIVISFFSGIVDSADRIRLGGYPAALRELLGLRVVDFLPLPADREVSVASVDLGAGRGGIWSELIELEGAEVLATFRDGDLDGRPAVTRRTFRGGAAYYLATRLDAETMGRLLRRAWTAAGIEPVLSGPPGLEAVRRVNAAGKSILFLLNHGDKEVVVEGVGGLVDLLTDRRQEGSQLRVGSREAAILDETG